ncbi:Sorting and assembly machinery component 50-like [Gracilariopsis chorda]|uniref:Sorting and assembly machinery component 50-like n=1 Tax=Gracilariopsis chorda TaxID=448386 RepID=A0A2V3IPE8_9FLOR|nr:Sorting and assembly machinery component 50-like [Gracilariopsis chorda]|eukprot:PXF43933.1 Sorting and assembly machinery component 50-like [Gracilariopsis chorda]
MSSSETQTPRATAQPSIEELLSTKLSITSFRVDGAQRTKASLLQRVLQPVLSTGGHFEGVISDVSQAVDRLAATNCFKGVDAFIDHDKHNPSAATVDFTVSEKSGVQLTTGTSIDSTCERDASLEGSLSLRNVCGVADTLRFTLAWMGGASASRSFSENPSNAFSASYKRPFVLGLDSAVFANGSFSQLNHTEASSYNLISRSVDSGIECPWGTFTLASSWRNLSDVLPTASQVIREDAKHSWKTSISHAVAVDSRDDAKMPSQGVFASLRHEHTLPFGDARYSSVEGSVQTHVPLVSHAVLSLCARGGVQVASKRAMIADRFFVGGGNSLRGFESRGIGPRDGKDAIGGDVFYTACAMLSVALPRQSLLWQLFRARVHAFINAGDVGEMSQLVESVGGVRVRGRGAREAADAVGRVMKEGARVAGGVGVALDTSVGRVEINLCQTVRRCGTDAARVGVQFGVSQSFL